MPLDIARLALIGARLISLGNELVEMSDDAKPLDDDTIWLARAIQGEGAALFGDQRDEVGLWIAHTALNRVHHPWWPEFGVIKVIRSAFHGVENVRNPDPWAIELAKRALNREEDVTGGALFMLSGDDLKRAGWSSDTAIRSFSYRDASFHFFRLWPGQ